MPERSNYAPGTPVWADLSSPDPKASVSYYDALFGWKAIVTGPMGEPAPKDLTGDGDDSDSYRMFLLGGKPAAGVGPLPPGTAPPVWATYIAVEDAEATSAKAAESGGATLMPPMEIGNAGRMAVLADTEGAVFCIWQPGDHKGASIFGEPNALSWCELATGDSAAAKDFYGNVFGWQADADAIGGDADYCAWTLDGEPVGGLMTMGDTYPEGVPPHWMTYFGADDVDAMASRAVELGGMSVVEPRDAGTARFAIVADTNGSVFGLIRPNAW